MNAFFSYFITSHCDEVKDIFSPISFGLLHKNRMMCWTKRVNPEGSLVVPPRAANGAGREACSGSSCSQVLLTRHCVCPKGGKDRHLGAPCPCQHPGCVHTVQGNHETWLILQADCMIHRYIPWDNDNLVREGWRRCSVEQIPSMLLIESNSSFADMQKTIFANFAVPNENRLTSGTCIIHPARILNAFPLLYRFLFI